MSERTINPFLLGIYGIEVTGAMVTHLRETGAAGIYLLRRNIETPDQVQTLVDRLQAELGYRILVAVDHECGTVCRFVRGITFFPGNMALGKTENPSLAYEVGRTMSRELAGMGINVNLAPVLDIAGEEYNPEVGTRSFGSDPVLVGKMGVELMRGLQEGGVSAAARHFPGRGSANGKPRQVAAVQGSKQALLDRDIAPFRAAIASGVDLVMTAHVRYASLDASQPAMFSSKITTDLLRQELAFDGVAVTEDLTSPLVLSAMSIEEAVVLAYNAGNDLLLLGAEVEPQKQAFRAIKMALEAGRVSPERSSQSQKRLKDLLKKRQSPAILTADAEDSDGGLALAEAISAAAVTIERDPGGLIPMKRDKRTGILFPRLADIGDRIALDDDLRGAAGLVQGWVQNHSSSSDVLEIPIQPEGDMVDLTLDWAAALDVVVYFCFDAARNSGQRMILEELQKRCKQLVVVLIGNPWDRTLVKEQTSVVQTYGFRVPQLLAAVDLVFKGA